MNLKLFIMNTQIEINIHHSINYKGWRSGIVQRVMEDVASFYQNQKSFKISSLESSKYPNNTYGLYHKQYGKKHSQYPKL